MSGLSSPLLEKIQYPQDFRHFSLPELQILAQEVREEVINTVSKLGGHLGASLGVVELTIALHYVFNTPEDLLIWDVGHQTYPHKILTGRKHLMHTIRQPNGLSGFAKRSESLYDVFGAGHTSTSVSAALGMAVARDLLGRDNEVIAVIGDGAMSAGMAYEAMNNAGSLKSRLVVVLNDNKMSIAPAVGAMSKYLARLLSSEPYINIRNFAKNIFQHLPNQMESWAKKAEQCAKNLATGGNFFEEMGFYYIGPVDGHDIEQLVAIFKNIKSNTNNIKSPILIHTITEKGRGFDSPEKSIESYHAVKPFDMQTRVQKKPNTSKYTYTNVFSNTLSKIASKDKSVVAITAAMPSGTGLDTFAKEFPERTFDVGIAEQHAVTFAAGLASAGMRPFVAIYSTFLQRAYDQIVHDVAIQSLPVRFAIDRAGLVGQDGPTHAGSFDLAYLINLPNFIIMAPSDEEELAAAVATAHSVNDKPVAFRYPRAEIIGDKLPDNSEPFKIGESRMIKHGNDIAILSLGTRLAEAIRAAEHVQDKLGITITIADARFAKPLDSKLISTLATTHRGLISIEEGATGGFGSYVGKFLSDSNLLGEKFIFKTMVLPDKFIEQNSIESMYQEAELDYQAIVAVIKSIFSLPPVQQKTVKESPDGKKDKAEIQQMAGSTPKIYTLR